METSYKQVAKYLQSVVEDPSQIEIKQTEENGVGSISAFYETAQVKDDLKTIFKTVNAMERVLEKTGYTYQPDEEE